MAGAVITAIAQIQTSKEGYLLINDDDLLVVAPEGWQNDIRVANDLDIRPHSLEYLFSVDGLVRNKGGLPVYQNVNFDPSLSEPLNQMVEPVFQVIALAGPHQVELRRYPPSGNQHFLLGTLHDASHFTKILLPIY